MSTPGLGRAVGTQRRVLGFAGALVLLVVVGALWGVAASTRDQFASGQEIARVNAGRAALVGVFIALLDAETGQRGYLIAGDTSFLEPYRSARARLDARLADVRTALAADPVSAPFLPALERLSRERAAGAERTLQLYRDQGAAAARAAVADGGGKAVMDSIRGVLAQVGAVQRTQLAALGARWTAGHRRTLLIVASLGAVVIGILALAAWQLTALHRDRDAAASDRRRFFEVSHDLLCVADFEGRFLELSPSWTSALGYDRADMTGKPFLDFVHPEDRERTAAEAATIGAGNATARFRNRYLARDGSWRWLEWASTPDVARKLIYASARDVTAQVDADAEIAGLIAERTLQAEQLAAANRELEAFTYSVAHDLRAPIRHIGGFVDLAERDLPAGSDSARRRLEVIRGAARRMGALVDDLLAFSRVGRATLQIRDAPLDGVVSEARAEVERDLGPRVIRWEIPRLPLVRGDAALLRVVFVNLLGNAVKYTATRPEAVISLAVDTRDTMVGITVRDNGVGFDMTYRDKLFGVFQRLHREDEFPGTGIGLATVHRIVSRHGGSVSAEGAPDRGAAFTVTLPLAAEATA